MKTGFIIILLIVSVSTALSDPYGETIRDDSSQLYYSGGTNLLISSQNPHDWRKHLEIESILVEDDLTVEEMRYICQIPNIKVIQLGKSPEVMKLRPAVLNELINAKRLQSISLNVDSLTLTEADLKIFLKIPQISFFSLFVGPDWEVIGNMADKLVPLEDKIGFRIAELRNLKSLHILSDSKFTNSFLKRLAELKNLSDLDINSFSFGDESLRILGKMNLSRLSISLPKTDLLSFYGLRNSPIRELALRDINQKLSFTVVLNESAYESLLSMRNLETIHMLKYLAFEGPNSMEKMQSLKRHLERNRLKNARKVEQIEAANGGRGN